MGVGSQCHAWPLYPQERELVLIVHGTGWVQGLVWTGAEGLAPVGVQFPDSPARSKSLY